MWLPWCFCFRALGFLKFLDQYFHSKWAVPCAYIFFSKRNFFRFGGSRHGGILLCTLLSFAVTLVPQQQIFVLVLFPSIDRTLQQITVRTERPQFLTFQMCLKPTMAMCTVKSRYRIEFLFNDMVMCYICIVKYCSPSICIQFLCLCGRYLW